MTTSLAKSGMAVAIAALSMGTANASLVTFTDTYTPASPVFLSASNTTYSFTQSILAQGFNTATDTITAASLELFFRDDRGNADGSEKVDIYVDQQRVISGFEANGSVVYNLDLPFTALTDGELFNSLIDIRVGGANTQIGDFYFDKSILTVAVERVVPQVASQAANNVPEPASLALTGLALAGLGFSRKGRKSSAK